MGPLADVERPKSGRKRQGESSIVGRTPSAILHCNNNSAAHNEQAHKLGKPYKDATLQNVRKWAARRIASGPSLGRKRPRRATAAQSATAPQYRVVSSRNARDADLIFYANLQMCPSGSGTGCNCNHVTGKNCL